MRGYPVELAATRVKTPEFREDMLSKMIVRLTLVQGYTEPIKISFKTR